MKIIEGFQAASSPKLDDKIILFKDHCIFQEKLDGTRIQAPISKTEHCAFTRRVSKEEGYYKDRTGATMNWRPELLVLHEAAVALDWMNEDEILVLDGEAAPENRMVGFIQIHSTEWFQKLNYFVYDLVRHGDSCIRDEWDVRDERIIDLFEKAAVISGNPDFATTGFVRYVPWYEDPSRFLVNQDFDWNLTFFELAMEHINKEVTGHEGFMMKEIRGDYKLKRGKNWWKVKELNREDVLATGFEYGKGKYTDVCGRLLIESFDGKRSGTVAGMDDQTRREILGWNFPKIIEIFYQETTSRAWRHPRSNGQIKEPSEVEAFSPF